MWAFRSGRNIQGNIDFLIGIGLRTFYDWYIRFDFCVLLINNCSINRGFNGRFLRVNWCLYFFMCIFRNIKSHLFWRSLSSLNKWLRFVNWRLRLRDCFLDLNFRLFWLRQSLQCRLVDITWRGCCRRWHNCWFPRFFLFSKNLFSWLNFELRSCHLSYNRSNRILNWLLWLLFHRGRRKWLRNWRFANNIGLNNWCFLWIWRMMFFLWFFLWISRISFRWWNVNIWLLILLPCINGFRIESRWRLCLDCFLHLNNLFLVDWVFPRLLWTETHSFFLIFM